MTKGTKETLAILAIIILAALIMAAGFFKSAMIGGGL